jgi:predicted alpha/beta hydrolase family esterase
MKKVFIIHGYGGEPNGGWRAWLMSELNKQDIWAFSLALPNPKNPILHEWLAELHHQIELHKDDDIYLVGHSLGVTTILRYLQSNMTDKTFPGAVLVSGPIESLHREELENFLDKPFDFAYIKSKVKAVSVIHGDTDDRVPLAQGETLAKALGTELIVVPNGGHLNGRSGWHILPQCLETLIKIIEG